MGRNLGRGRREGGGGGVDSSFFTNQNGISSHSSQNRTKLHYAQNSFYIRINLEPEKLG